MAESGPAIIQEGPGQPTEPALGGRDLIEMDLEIDQTHSLLSMEKLDRASPELWPEQIPGLSGFAPHQSSRVTPPWNTKRAFTQEDINLMNQLGALSTSNIILEVKKLHDLAYRLGVEEAKEMTRGKYLNVFTSKKNSYDY